MNLLDVIPIGTSVYSNTENKHYLIAGIEDHYIALYSEPGDSEILKISEFFQNYHPSHNSRNWGISGAMYISSQGLTDSLISSSLIALEAYGGEFIHEKNYLRRVMSHPSSYLYINTNTGKINIVVDQPEDRTLLIKYGRKIDVEKPRKYYVFHFGGNYTYHLLCNPLVIGKYLRKLEEFDKKGGEESYLISFGLRFENITNQGHIYLSEIYKPLDIILVRHRGDDFWRLRLADKESTSRKEIQDNQGEKFRDYLHYDQNFVDQFNLRIKDEL